MRFGDMTAVSALNKKQSGSQAPEPAKAESNVQRLIRHMCEQPGGSAWQTTTFAESSKAPFVL